MKNSFKVLALGLFLALAGPAFAQQSATQQLSITVSATPLSITTLQSAVPNAVVGTPYSASFAAVGGVAPYSFSVTTQPTGTTISSAGVLSGTPTSGGGTSTFTVKVSDSESTPLTAIATYTITIYTQLKITTTTLPAATVGVAYNQTIAVVGGTAPYTFSVVGTLPVGLSLNSVTGVISGVPTTGGSSTFTITVTDSSLVAQTETNNNLMAKATNESSSAGVSVTLHVVSAGQR